MRFVIGDIPEFIRVKCRRGAGNAVPLDGLETAELKVEKPSGTTFSKSGTVFGDADDGVVSFGSFTSGDFDAAGEYDVEVILVFDTGARLHGVNPFEINVRAEFEDAN